MTTVIIEIEEKKQLELLTAFLKGLRITPKILTKEEHEDLGLIELMKEDGRNKKVSQEKVMKKLSM